MLRKSYFKYKIYSLHCIFFRFVRYFSYSVVLSLFKKEGKKRRRLKTTFLGFSFCALKFYFVVCFSSKVLDFK